MHVPINVKSPNNISKWQMGFNSAFKGLTAEFVVIKIHLYVTELILRDRTYALDGAAKCSAPAVHFGGHNFEFRPRGRTSLLNISC